MIDDTKRPDTDITVRQGPKTIQSRKKEKEKDKDEGEEARRGKGHKREEEGTQGGPLPNPKTRKQTHCHLTKFCMSTIFDPLHSEEGLAGSDMWGKW